MMTPEQVLAIYLTLGIAYLYWLLLELWTVFDHSKAVINQLPKIDDVEYASLYGKASYLLEKTREFSKALGMKPPPLYIVDNDTDQATAVNMFFFKGVLFELKTLRGLSKEALGAVLAHELYHIKKCHYLRGVFFRGFWNTVGVVAIAFIITDFVITKDSWVWFFVSFFSAAGMIQGLHWIILAFDNYFGRRDEMACDKFSIKMMGPVAFKQEAEYFIESNLKEDLKNPPKKRPLPVAALRSFVLNTHPSWQKRLELISRP